MDLSNFAGKAIFITGSTGFLGKYLVETFLSGADDIRVIAHGRSREKMEACFRFCGNRACLDFVVGDIREPIDYEGAVDYVIHGASLTASVDFIQKPLDTIETALDGTRRVLEFAQEKKVEKMIYLSSMEIYGSKNFSNSPVGEEDYGYLDLLDVRNSYPESKRMCETLCHCYYKERNVPVVMARLTQIFGGKLEATDQRMFAQFLRNGACGRDIVLKTQGETVRGYCHVEDAFSGLCLLCLAGAEGQAYTVCHPEMNVSVRALAEEIGAFYGVAVRIEEESTQGLGYLPPFRLVLSAEKLMALGWEPKMTLKKALEREGRATSKC